MEVNKETWTVFVLNAIVIPVIVYWLIASALHLGNDARGMLVIVVEMSGLGLTMWRWWSAFRRQLES